VVSEDEHAPRPRSLHDEHAVAVVLLPEAIHNAVAVVSALEELEVPVTRADLLGKSA
jgi:hypothetical protein